MKTIKKYTIGLFILVVLMTACGGGSDSPAPTPVADQVIGSNWTLSAAQDASGTEVSTTFLLQSFTLIAAGNVLNATTYPNAQSISGTWQRVSDTALTLTLESLGIQLTSIVVNGNTLTATISIPSGLGGKTATFSGTVTYTKQ